MKEKGNHEGCIEQIQRLFGDYMAADSAKALDEKGRIRIDDWEMEDDVQAAVASAWEAVTTENLGDLSDFSGYQKEFLKLFGFGLDSVDYSAETTPERPLPSES